MTKVYQIVVRGSSLYFDNRFKAYSSDVYTSKPEQKYIDKFIESCQDKKYFDILDVSEPYEINIIEHNVIDNDINNM